MGVLKIKELVEEQTRYPKATLLATNVHKLYNTSKGEGVTTFVSKLSVKQSVCMINLWILTTSFMDVPFLSLGDLIDLGSDLDLNNDRIDF